MKRSKSINLQRMRKTATPLATGVAATTLVACGGGQEAEVFANVEQCTDAHPELRSQCETAYEKALQQAADSGPKYSSMYDCSADFGNDNCRSYQHGSSNWFVPAMGGFLFAQAIDNRRHYHSSPVYTSYSRYSPYYGRWSTVDGRDYGRARYGSKVRVGNDTFKPKPKVTRTISRGGFGSSVSAKSSWGGSRSSRGGWGG
ncbi:Uncharacterised protein [BD1-7 clade bacterium]|uniref:DUF1190 domain-containing protein n=1 Tax=BD1-7 clade bacterium TaxID=2029982 RepID=A0A5S9N1L2_9GAMM|nr:Uncharacterised protein [BD1-7 clade bacterium]CAA0083533.1 Uncharacterised protein [BD1-7 clade bacterium]